uniref:Uncharacterized protein n=1 Tax=Micrurus lemniscatus lemniscatus TaxID=129467 RepID=A0A2D4ICP0_MICLE
MHNSDILKEWTLCVHREKKYIFKKTYIVNDCFESPINSFFRFCNSLQELHNVDLLTDCSIWLLGHFAIDIFLPFVNHEWCELLHALLCTKKKKKKIMHCVLV